MTDHVLQNVICFKHQNQVSCCCEPISYGNKPHVSCLILHSGLKKKIMQEYTLKSHEQ